MEIQVRDALEFACWGERRHLEHAPFLLILAFSLLVLGGLIRTRRSRRVRDGKCTFRTIFLGNRARSLSRSGHCGEESLRVSRVVSRGKLTEGNFPERARLTEKAVSN